MSISGEKLSSVEYSSLGAFNVARFAKYLFVLDRLPCLTIEEIDALENAIRQLPDWQYYIIHFSWRGDEDDRWQGITATDFDQLTRWERDARERLRKRFTKLEEDLHERDTEREWMQSSDQSCAVYAGAASGDVQALRQGAG